MHPAEISSLVKGSNVNVDWAKEKNKEERGREEKKRKWEKENGERQQKSNAEKKRKQETFLSLKFEDTTAV